MLRSFGKILFELSCVFDVFPNVCIAHWDLESELSLEEKTAALPTPTISFLPSPAVPTSSSSSSKTRPSKPTAWPPLSVPTRLVSSTSSIHLAPSIPRIAPQVSGTSSSTAKPPAPLPSVYSNFPATSLSPPTPRSQMSGLSSLVLAGRNIGTR